MKLLKQKETKEETIENCITSFINFQPKYENENYEPTGKLQGKNVVITAGGHGMANAAALAYAKERANIILVYHNIKYQEDLKVFKQKNEEMNQKIWLIKSSTFDEFKCVKLLDNISKKVDHIDRFINLFPILNKTESHEAHYLLRKTDTLKIQSLFTMGKLAPEYLDPKGIIINATCICSYVENLEKLTNQLKKIQYII